METNDTNKKSEKIIHKELSYKVGGILYQAHTKLGRYALENQYSNIIENILKQEKIPYEREKSVTLSGTDRNRIDFVISGIILLELKTKPFLVKDDYYQTLRYLEASELRLGIIANFRSEYLRPKRIINPRFN